MGKRPYDAKERADVFRRHNIRAMEAILPHWQDVEARTKIAISSRDQLERQMENDRKAAERHTTRGWHTDPPPPGGEAEMKAEEAAEEEAAGEPRS